MCVGEHLYKKYKNLSKQQQSELQTAYLLGLPIQTYFANSWRKIINSNAIWHLNMKYRIRP